MIISNIKRVDKYIDATDFYASALNKGDKGRRIDHWKNRG